MSNENTTNPYELLMSHSMRASVRTITHAVPPQSELLLTIDPQFIWFYSGLFFVLSISDQGDQLVRAHYDGTHELFVTSELLSNLSLAFTNARDTNRIELPIKTVNSELSLSGFYLQDVIKCFGLNLILAQMQQIALQQEMKLHERIYSLTHLKVSAQLAKLLLDLQNPRGIISGYSHENLANMLHVYRESITDLLKIFVQNNILRTTKMNIEILDNRKLEQIISGELKVRRVEKSIVTKQ